MPASSLAALRAQLEEAGLATTVKPNAGSGALPKGDYTLKVVHFTKTVSSENAKNPGALLYKVGFRVATGEQKGGSAWLNNSVTEENFTRAWGLMTGLFVAAGVPLDEINDPAFEPDDEWGKRNVLNKLVDSSVYVTPPKDGFREGNGFESFTPHEMTTEDYLND